MTMKRKRYTEPQIVFALQQAEAGTPVTEICRKLGVVEATFYRWKKRYGGLGVSDIRRLKQLVANLMPEQFANQSSSGHPLGDGQRATAPLTQTCQSDEEFCLVQ